MSARPAWVACVVVLAACRPGADLTVVSAEETGVLPRAAAIQGRDGGGSGLAFGRSVWAYGDTVLNAPDEVGTNWHTNSFDDADPADWRDGFHTQTDATGAPRYLVELTADETAWDAVEGNPRWALWPSEPLMDDDAGTAWILYGLYADGQPSGIGLASWAGLDAKAERRRFGDSWLLFPKPETEWANAPVVSDGWLYTFGCEPDGLARPCGVARVPIDAVDDRTAWRFFDGADWVPDSAEHTHLFDGAPIMAVSFVPALDRWMLVYAGVFSNEIVARTAPALTGPWSAETVLYTAPGDAPYDALHHSELQEADGAVQWVTYSRHTEGWFGSEHALWRVEIAAR